MFNNLIESTSHAREIKRRGSFLLFTTATYLVLFVVAGVASIYAYDAHLGSQNTELEITFVPILPDAAPTEIARTPVRLTSTSERAPTRPERTQLIDSTANPNNPPETVSSAAQPIPPAPPNAVISYRNVDPDTSISSGRGVPGGTGNTPIVNIPDNPPPPAPNPTPSVARLVRTSVVLNSKALDLPKPAYPPMAKQIRVQGTVNVQVLIDEVGRVVSARAVSGHPLLVPEAQKAALKARFSPTIIGEQAVKVSGVITYNFVMP